MSGRDGIFGQGQEQDVITCRRFSAIFLAFTLLLLYTEHWK
jgi:hypothetical protein